MAALVVVDLSNPQTITLVCNVSISIIGASYSRFNFFPQVVEDFLKVSMVGDLHVVEFHLLTFRSGCRHLAPVSWRWPSLKVLLSAPVSWCWKIECHLVASLENTLLGFG